jgi:hypothetical protein
MNIELTYQLVFCCSSNRRNGSPCFVLLSRLILLHSSQNHWNRLIQTQPSTDRSSRDNRRSSNHRSTL